MGFFKCGGGGNGSGFISLKRINGNLYHYENTATLNKTYTYSLQESNTTYTGTIILTTTSTNTGATLDSTETLTIESYDGSSWTTINTQTGTRPSKGSVTLSVSGHVSNVKGIRATIVSTDNNYYDFIVSVTG